MGGHTSKIEAVKAVYRELGGEDSDLQRKQKTGLKSMQIHQKVTQNALIWRSPGSPKGHFCGQFPFLLGSRGICENSGFVYMKHHF